MTRSRAAAWLAVLTVAGCSTGPRRGDDAVDPGVYTACQDPEAAAAWTRAQQALARGDDPTALSDLVLVVRRCPDLVRAHLAYQDAARRSGGAALQAMLDFYRQLPERPSPAHAYFRARLADTAYAQSNALEAILAQDRSFAWAHLSLARVQRRQGRMVPAYDRYSSAIVNDGQLHEARLERAQILVELGRDQEAAVDYRAYLAARGDDVPAIRDYVALLLYRLGRIEEARPWLERLERERPGDLTVRMDRAAAQWRSGELREAADTYVSILHEDREAVRAALNLGLLFYEVVPQDETARRRYWPIARAAFRWFLDEGTSAEGHEQFERTLGVPYRMARIAELLGPEPLRAVRLDDLRWPASG